MNQQAGNGGEEPRASETTDAETTDTQDNELEAEQESAAAMDADVPQPPGANETTEGQPS